MLVNCLLEGNEEISSFPGFCYVLINVPGIDCAEEIRTFSVSRQNKAHRKRATLADMPEQVDPLHPRHALIRENNGRDESLFQGLEGGLATLIGRQLKGVPKQAL